MNGTLKTVKKLDCVGNDPYGYPVGRIYIQCDYPISGDKLKDNPLRPEFQDMVPIDLVVQSLKHNGRLVERNQFPITLANGMTTV